MTQLRIANCGLRILIPQFAIRNPQSAIMLTVIDHPLAQHYLTHLRDETTKPALFRTLTRKLATLLAIEASRDLRSTTARIRTPMEETDGTVLDDDLVIVPILRAGLGM